MVLPSYRGRRFDYTPFSDGAPAPPHSRLPSPLSPRPIPAAAAAACASAARSTYPAPFTAPPPRRRRRRLKGRRRWCGGRRCPRRAGGAQTRASRARRRAPGRGGGLCRGCFDGRDCDSGVWLNGRGKGQGAEPPRLLSLKQQGTSRNHNSALDPPPQNTHTQDTHLEVQPLRRDPPAERALRR